MDTSLTLAVVSLVPWMVLFVALMLTRRGRVYLRGVESDSAAKEAMAAREMGLGFTGLVFAGLAVAATSGGQPNVRVVELLAVALAGAVTSWTLSNLGYVLTGIVAGAGLLLSISAVLMAVAEILTGVEETGSVVLFTIGPSYLIVIAYGIFLARAHFRIARRREAC